MIQDGAPGRNRTCDTRIRNPVLYPLSYEGISGSIFLLISDPAEKIRFSRRCFNFPAHAADAVGANRDSPSSFLENFASCISGFLSGIRFLGFYSAIISGIRGICQVIIL